MNIYFTMLHCICNTPFAISHLIYHIGTIIMPILKMRKLSLQNNLNSNIPTPDTIFKRILHCFERALHC